MSGLLEWFKSRRESEVIRKTREHALKVNQVVHETQDFIKKAFQGKIPKKTQKRTEQIEHEADILRREIFSILTTGEINPNAREDLMHIVKRMDDVANNANAAVRRMALFNVVEFPDELKDLISKMMSHSIECSDMLKECIEKLGIEASEILRLTDRIGEIEHEVDLLNSNVKSFLINSNLTMNPFEAIVVHEFIERIENIADACEDTADIVKLMALRDEVR
ncbi:TIGR00153 family protein [Candidatus Borrarchaeum sp.]|uniref:TIGR00153 family protein n=1 Tax=Candidatus Borrarchaeum sp. TaxID=2846742 RepID=UPI00257C42A1|nr:TIGR00153 family protein [Candidatus Borrarchaeum sp.]